MLTESRRKSSPGAPEEARAEILPLDWIEEGAIESDFSELSQSDSDGEQSTTDEEDNELADEDDP